MRSVWLLIFARSNWATSQCFRISSQAFCGMMPSRAWARARPASKSRYFWIRFSSENTRRIGSVEKMSRKTAESMAVVGIRDLSEELLEIEGRGGRRDVLEHVPFLRNRNMLSV